MADSVNIHPFSWLIGADFAKVGNVLFFDRSNPPLIEEDETDRLFTIRTHDRIDNLGDSFYSSPRRWWLIARANNMFLAPNELLPGREMRIPTLARMKQDGTI